MLKLSSLFLAATVAAATVAVPAHAEDYVIDTAKAHAFVQFRIKHLGYSWLYGRFNTFSGTFSYDEKDPAASKVAVTIETNSIDTNNAERNKHLKSADFLDVEQFPEAKFTSTAYEEAGDGSATLKGDLTLHGVTKPISIAVDQIGHGPDPWGGYRRGFHGTTTLTLADYGIDYNLGPASTTVEMELSVEGIRQ